jgi:uncharacterized protein (TIGR02145 family)
VGLGLVSAVAAQPGLGCPTEVVYQDHRYPVVQVGTQCWLAENLQAHRYQNGDAIPQPRTGRGWRRAEQGASQACLWPWGGDVAPGRFYNAYAVTDPRGLCPTGWAVPTDADWSTLEETLGDPRVAATHLKSLRWDGDDAFGFRAHPVGYIGSTTGEHDYIGTFTYFWSSTPEETGWVVRGLALRFPNIDRRPVNPQLGMSVRCLQPAVASTAPEPEPEPVPAP